MFSFRLSQCADRRRHFSEQKPDGVGRATRFSGPRGVAATRDGILYVADTWNHTIRMGTPVPARAAPPGLRLASDGALDWLREGTDWILETVRVLGLESGWEPATTGIRQEGSRAIFLVTPNEFQRYYRLRASD